MPVRNSEALADTLAGNIRKLHAGSGIVRAELDLSGGIDSAVMLGLLALAVGPDNITTIFLGINSNPDAYSRAKGLSDALGTKLIHFDGTQLFHDLVRQMLAKMETAGFDRAEIEARIAADPTIFGSIRSTLRAPWGRAANRITGGGIRHGTGNEDEDRWVRFFQKGGDGEVDTNPISMLSKGEVYQLARYLGKRLDAVDAYERIINATPSADLWGNGDQHNDESEIGNYLGVKGYPYYSYIDGNGEYRTVGLIERVSRFLDRTVTVMGGVDVHDGIDTTNGAILFDDRSETGDVDYLCTRAKEAPEFAGIAYADVEAVLRSARRIERVTRHKLNPNCPALTARADLVSAGILTDTLPTNA